MIKDGKMLIGKNDDKEIFLYPDMACRHGLITGASGSGKSTTLKVMAESFSQSGVPVFLVDVKGDLASIACSGEPNENVDSRVEKMNLEGFSYKKFPTTFFDVYGKNGHPIRAKISSIDARLLSRMLNLSDTQEEVLGCVYRIAEAENLELIDLNDLDYMLSYVSNKRESYSREYGNISTQTLNSIKRSVQNVKENGGNDFFGEPSFDIRDFMRYDANGYGYINILDAQDLFKSPTTYVIMLLWLLNSVFNDMPEAGEVEKPKLVFFIDEAHLIFSEMKENVIKQLIQIVKLIRSKGIGLYFISQAPTDICDDVLSQLSNRVQHVLRAYTKSDEKNIKAAANGFRDNPSFDTKEAIRLLGTGEALISFLNENGEPSVVEKVKILPPESRMGVITDAERETIIRSSLIYNKYENRINSESAEEKIQKIFKEEDEIRAKEEAEKEKLKNAKKAKKEVSEFDRTKKKIKNRTESFILTKVLNKLYNVIFKK